MLTGGFDGSLSGLNVFHIDADQVKARLVVSDSVQKLHGGAIATRVATAGDTVLIEARVLSAYVGIR